MTQNSRVSIEVQCMELGSAILTTGRGREEPWGNSPNFGLSSRDEGLAKNTSLNAKLTGVSILNRKSPLNLKISY